jgi:hypothetical protein
MVTIKIKWDMVNTVIGLVLFVAVFAMLLPVVVASNKTTNVTKTTNDTKLDAITQLISKFRIVNIEEEGNCTKVIATSDKVEPFKKVDAVTVWCNDRIYIVAIIQR